MAKYRKKPVIIEAEQFVNQIPPYPKGVCVCDAIPDRDDVPHVHTIHDNQRVDLAIGDFVIPEPDGEHYYPCKSDIFHATYEPVEE